MSNDPFVHHPGLRGLVADPALSRFRSITTAGIKDMLAGKGYPTDWLRTDAEREALRRAFLGELLHGHAGDLWVFAYGSLMWDPALLFTQVRRAHLPGYARRFILRDVHGGRGTPEAPGLMAALDHGEEGCDGLVFQIAAAQIDAETNVLWQREMIGSGYYPVITPAQTAQGPVQCLCFVADHAAEAIVPQITRQEQIRCLVSGEGFLGTSLDYLRGIAGHFAVLGIEDAHVSGLLEDAEVAAG